MDIFGSTDPKLMPGHLFSGALHLDYATAIRSDPGRQNYSICPRHWFIDAVFRCDMCGCNFVWSAAEQKKWFEEWRFWIDSHPNQCNKCRKKRRAIKAARQEYDSIIDQARAERNTELKIRVMALIDEMGGPDARIPDSMKETYIIFRRQLQKAAQQGAQPDASGAG